jgi:hypothetical protein
VKEAKLYNFMAMYDKFKMLEDESMSEMFYKFNVIVNDIRNLGNKVGDEDFDLTL